MVKQSPQSPTEPAPDALKIRGADISLTLQEESLGQTFAQNGRVAPVEEILAANGANYVRLRVWIDPPTGYTDKAAALTLAQRAKKAGMKLFLNLHYSDFWADSKTQTTPPAWQQDDLPTLAQTVKNYTRGIVREFAEQGTPVDMIQIGNEVNKGMLWPIGRIYKPTGEDWTSFAALLNAGIDGAREGNAPGHDMSVVIHIDRGGDNKGTRYFFDQIQAAGVTDFDAIGLTYYPFWQGPLADLQNNLNDLAPRYNKDLIIAETAYPWTMAGGVPNFGFADESDLPDPAKYPPSITGQTRYFLDLRDVLLQVPDGRGAGLFVFEPEWLPGVGLEPGAPNPWANLTMFDWSGRMLPALAVALVAPK